LSYFTFNITDSSGNTGSLEPDIGFQYTDNLNEVNEAQIKFSGSVLAARNLINVGSILEIKKDGTRAFYGLIDMVDFLDAGAMDVHASGYEIRAGKEFGTYANSPWQATASATIATAIIGESTYFSAGTIETGSDIDFRADTTSSIYNALGSLTKITAQDIGIDYVNLEIDILDHKGSATVVNTFNDGVEMSNLRVTHGFPAGNIIIVRGKGDGDNQITATDSDATSISAYGSITRIVSDRTIISDAQAATLATAELALTKDPTKIYDFDINTVNESLVSGDHVSLNSVDKDLANEEVRVVGITRGYRGGIQFLSVQVTNPAYKQMMRSRNRILSQITKKSLQDTTYMQGATIWNSWGSGINVKNSYPLKIGFFVPTQFKDEADNLQINLMTVDYELQEFRQTAGSASFTGSDPQVQNTSGTDAPDVENTSATTEPDVSGSSGSIAPAVEDTSGSTAPGVSGTSGSTTPNSLSGNNSYAGNTEGDTINAQYSRTKAFDDVYGTVSFSLGAACTYCYNTTGVSQTINLAYSTSGGASGTFGSYSLANGSYYAGSGGTSSEGSWENEYVRFFDNNGAVDWWWGTCNMIYSHTHGSHTHSDGSYAAASHGHAAGTYNAVSHLHSDGTLKTASHTHADGTYSVESHDHPDGSYDINATDLDHISIGSDISESGSVNSSEVTIYLDFWNGSAWVNKHSVVSAATIGSDVDITDSGTYPDATGYWRVRIDPNSATADYCEGIVKLKFHIDS